MWWSPSYDGARYDCILVLRFLLNKSLPTEMISHNYQHFPGQKGLNCDIVCRGDELRLTSSNDNLINSGFNDKTSSFEIFTGIWQLYLHTRYRGFSSTYGPGRYQTEIGLSDNQYSSVKRLAVDAPDNTEDDGCATVNFTMWMLRSFFMVCKCVPWTWHSFFLMLWYTSR